MTNDKILFTQDFTHDTGYWWFAFTDAGLAIVSTPDHADHAVQKWLETRLDYNVQPAKDGNIVAKKHESALIDLLGGRAGRYSQPFDIKATKFQQSVWQAMSDVPYGQTVSYADLAAEIGNPKAIRAVGTACGANPVPLAFPCHRILRSNGELGGFGLGLDVKQRLLTYEAEQSKKQAA